MAIHVLHIRLVLTSRRLPTASASAQVEQQQKQQKPQPVPTTELRCLLRPSNQHHRRQVHCASLQW